MPLHGSPPGERLHRHGNYNLSRLSPDNKLDCVSREEKMDQMYKAQSFLPADIGEKCTFLKSCSNSHLSACRGRSHAVILGELHLCTNRETAVVCNGVPLYL